MEDMENTPTGTPHLMPASISIETVIAGLASDLEALRHGRISVQHAQAAANLGKQVLNGMRLVVNARKLLSSGGKDVTPENTTELEGNDVRNS